MREAPAIYIIKELGKARGKYQAYDPKAMKEAKHFYLKDVDQCRLFRLQIRNP